MDLKTNNFILKLYSITLTGILIYLVISGFTMKKKLLNKFEEITVKRINIIEPDGKLKMVISNGDKQHFGMVNGEKFPQRKRPPGLIFFNEEQDEVGGLVYSGNKKNGSAMVLSFDQYKNDQVMQMQYLRGVDGKQLYGMNFWDRSNKITLPKLLSIVDSLKESKVSNTEMMSVLKKMNNGKPIATERMFTGKNLKEEVGMFIKDQSGNNRINIYIDKDNNPKFEILDKEGKIVRELVKDN